MIGDFVNAGFYLSAKVLFDQTVAALASCQRSKTISVRISASWSLANVADAIARRPDKLPHIPKDAQSLQPLANAAIAASRDHEKVRANGIRALGHLFRETHFSGFQPNVEWLNGAVECLQASLQDGSAKVKWNACYATGSLASNSGLRQIVSLNGTLPLLVGLLVHLINENPNFKVQMQAAAAMENIPESHFFKEAFLLAISAVARRLHILQDGSQEGLPEADADTELIQPTVDASFPNFKYHEGLKRQLESTLMHLLSLLDAPFSDTCIFPRPDVLFNWLKRSVDRTVETSVEEPAISESKHKLSRVLDSLMNYESNLADWGQLKAMLLP